MFWKIGLLVTISGVGFVAWVWQRYLRIVVNLFLGVVVRSTPDEEQRFEGEEVILHTGDGVELAGTLARPARGERPPVVVFCPEFGADRRSAGPYAHWLLEAGYAVLAFDFRGHGDSKNTDDYVPRQWATERELTDLEAAVAYVRARSDLAGEQLVLFGISRGGAVATASAASVRTTPSGVRSKAHARTTAMGNPKAARTTTSVSVQSGSDSAGNTTSPICMRIHATTK